MKKLQHLILGEQGIHARIATVLVSIAKKYSSDITMWKGGESADMKNLFAVMKLYVKQNETITIDISGEDECEAAQEMEQVLSSV